MPSRERVRQLIEQVERGKFVAAIREFYADDARMQENLQPPRTGLAALVAGEQKTLASVRQVRTLPVEWFMVEGDRAVIRWVFEFTLPDGTVSRLDEVAVQRWCGDRIVEERFYDDPGQRRAAA